MQKDTSERNKKMVAMHDEEGRSCQEIAKIYGISASRVNQIIWAFKKKNKPLKKVFIQVAMQTGFNVNSSMLVYNRLAREYFFNNNDYDFKNEIPVNYILSLDGITLYKMRNIGPKSIIYIKNLQDYIRKENISFNEAN